ncbi:MAG: ASKHA domain-containing protein [Candidatus Omnitrophica bacterium]|nr:ASKHA domain-containing protein [Candidatus Omnitrophota bacterium]
MKKYSTCAPPRKINQIISRIPFQSGLSLILDHDEIIQIEKNKKEHIFGIAVDVGTTSVGLSLCNLESFQELASATRKNEQAEFGMDLEDRLKFAAQSEENYELLNRKLIEVINDALGECISKSGVNSNRIFSAILVGAPLMHHILFSLPLENLQNIGEKGHYIRLHRMKAGKLGLNINKAANVRFLPEVDDKIGSDTLATILSLGLHRGNKKSLCIDLGMDAKIILGTKKETVAAIIQTGSVFEGHMLKCGMVSRAGAIEWFRIVKGKIKILTKGHIRPRGISGSGIIDIVSELLKEKFITRRGRMKKSSFVVYEDKKRVIELTQLDLDKILRSKAAVSAGIQILMKTKKTGNACINKVFLTGNLGNYLNADNAVRIGLIEKQLKNKISFQSNASLEGAKLALLWKCQFKKIIELSQEVKHFSFKRDKEFKKAYKKELKFPG